MGIWVKRGLAILVAGGIVFLVATRVFEAREDAARAKTRGQGWAEAAWSMSTSPKPGRAPLATYSS